MKTIRVFLSEKFQFLVVKFSIYLNRRVFVMRSNWLQKHVERPWLVTFCFVISVNRECY